METDEERSLLVEGTECKRRLLKYIDIFDNAYLSSYEIEVKREFGSVFYTVKAYVTDSQKVYIRRAIHDLDVPFI